MSNLIVIIDTREQLPYSFSSEIKTEIKELVSGDYSILGHEDKFSIERKSLDDYVKSISEDRDRFYREIKRLQKFNFAAIVVEGSLEDIHQHKYSSPEVTEEQVLGTTVSIILDYKIPVLFCSDRQHAIWIVEKFINMYYKHYVEKEARVIINRETLKDAKAREKGKRNKKNSRKSDEDLL